MSQNLDLSKLTKDQLKDQLRTYNLKVGGNKDDLLARLQAAMSGVPDPTVKSVALPKTAPKTVKKSVKNPTDKLTSVFRDAEQKLGVSLAVLLNVYGADDLYDQMMELVGDRSESLPQQLEVPSTEGLNEAGLKEMTISDLKNILKSRGEKLAGKKDELIQRILNPSPKQPVKSVVSVSSPMDEAEWTEDTLKEMKMADLKNILKSRGEKLGGKKDELIERILHPTSKEPVNIPVPVGVLNNMDAEGNFPSVPLKPLSPKATLPPFPKMPVGNFPMVPTSPKGGLSFLNLPTVPGVINLTTPGSPPKSPVM